MIFDRDQTAAIRAGKQTATLQPSTVRMRPMTLRPLKRRTTTHDPDGNPTGHTTSTVTDQDGNSIRLTITAIESRTIATLTQQDAKDCGHKTTTALRDAWQAQHPRTQQMLLVRFAVGDITDKDRYIAWTGQAGGDYTTNPSRASDPGAALTPDEQAAYTRAARARDEQRTKDPIKRARDEIARQLEQIDDQLHRQPNRDLAKTVRALRHQLRSLDRKLRN